MKGWVEIDSYVECVDPAILHPREVDHARKFYPQSSSLPDHLVHAVLLLCCLCKQTPEHRFHSH